jgi:hypothetical protein
VLCRGPIPKVPETTADQALRARKLVEIYIVNQGNVMKALTGAGLVLLVLILALSLAGCGGGGGGSDGSSDASGVELEPLAWDQGTWNNVTWE